MAGHGDVGGESRRVSSRNRRKSVLDKFDHTRLYIQQSFAQLTDLWDEIALSDSCRQDRVSTAFGHIHTLVDEMVQSEMQMVADVKADIVRSLARTDELRDILKMPVYETEHPNPSLALHRVLEKEVAQLEEQFRQRREDQDSICNRIAVLAHRIDREEMVPIGDELLSSEELDVHRMKLIGLESELNRRAEKATQLQKEMLKWRKQIGNELSLVDDSDLESILSANMANDEFPLGDTMMESIEQYHKQLSSIYENWCLDQDFKWVSQYETMCDLWDKCHFAPEQRSYPAQFNPAVHKDQDFQSMLLEEKRLKAVYEMGKPIFTLLNSWKDLWQQKVELDEKKADPGYYQSRDSSRNILKDSQKERYLETNLVKLRQSLEETYKKHLEEGNDVILIGSMNPPKYVEYVIAEYKLCQEKKRADRHAKRAQAAAAGSNRSPMKSKCPRTPTSCAKLEPLAKRTMSEQSMRFPSSRTTSPAHMPTSRLPSMIAPPRHCEPGPKTSSPKQQLRHAPSSPAIREFATPLKRNN